MTHLERNCGLKSEKRKKINLFVRYVQCWGLSQHSFKENWKLFLEEQSSWDVKVTICFYLVRRVRTCGANTQFYSMNFWHVNSVNVFICPIFSNSKKKELLSFKVTRFILVYHLIKNYYHKYQYRV